MRKLKELCHIEKGTTGIMKAIPGKYPMVGIAEERRTHTSYQFDTAAVLIPLVSSTGHGHASLKRIHYQAGKFALGSILCALIPKDPAQLDPLFLYHYLDVYKEQLFVPLMKGMANVSLSMTSIGSVEVPVPTKAQQNEWVKKFEWVNEQQSTLTGELDHQRTLLKQLRQAILQEAVQGKLTAAWRASNPELVSGANHAAALLDRIRAEKDVLVQSGKLRKPKPLRPITLDEVPFELPEAWVWCRLGDIALRSAGGSSPQCAPRPVVNSEWGVIKMGAVTWDEFDEYENKYLSNKAPEELSQVIRVGDLIITRANTRELVGKSVVVKEVNFNLLLNDKTIRFELANDCNREYVSLCNNAPHGREHYMHIATGSSPTMKNVSRDGMNSLLIPLPPAKEQARIVEEMKRLNEQFTAFDDEITRCLSRLTVLLQSVLSEVIVGGAKYGVVEGGLSLAADAHPKERAVR